MTEAHYKVKITKKDGTTFTHKALDFIIEFPVLRLTLTPTSQRNINLDVIEMVDLSFVEAAQS